MSASLTMAWTLPIITSDSLSTPPNMRRNCTWVAKTSCRWEDSMEPRTAFNTFCSNSVHLDFTTGLTNRLNTYCKKNGLEQCCANKSDLLHFLALTFQFWFVGSIHLRAEIVFCAENFSKEFCHDISAESFGTEFWHEILCRNFWHIFSLPKFWAKTLAPCQNFRHKMIFWHADV